MPSASSKSSSSGRVIEQGYQRPAYGSGSFRHPECRTAFLRFHRAGLLDRGQLAGLAQLLDFLAIPPRRKLGRFAYGVEGNVREDSGCYSVHGSPPFSRTIAWPVAGVRAAALSLQQHDPPHRPTGDALYACQQFRLGRQSAAAVVAHLGEDVAQHPIAPPWGVALIDYLDLAAARRSRGSSGISWSIR
jgi:hypothetical protein